MGLHLRDLGCEVDLAHDGSTGLQQALSKPYNLVILDLDCTLRHAAFSHRGVQPSRYKIFILDSELPIVLCIDRFNQR